MGGHLQSMNEPAHERSPASSSMKNIQSLVRESGQVLDGVVLDAHHDSDA